MEFPLGDTPAVPEEEDVEGYCAPKDILIDAAYLPLPSVSRYKPYIESASSFVDVSLQGIYVTPLRFVGEPDAVARDEKMVRTICSYLASGTMVLGLTAGNEDARVHAYGKWLIDQGEMLLGKLIDGEISLDTADRNPSGQDDTNAGPLIGQGQSQNLTDGYYHNFEPYGPMPGQMRPNEEGDWPFDFGETPPRL